MVAVGHVDGGAVAGPDVVGCIQLADGLPGFVVGACTLWARYVHTGCSVTGARFPAHHFSALLMLKLHAGALFPCCLHSSQDNCPTPATLIKICSCVASKGSLASANAPVILGAAALCLVPSLLLCLLLLRRRLQLDT